MELIKSAAKRSKVSDIVYVLLNIALAGGIFALTFAFSPPYLAYLLVLLSKWRVLAVRPRFWLANIQGNIVDILVGLSTVTLIWRASGALTAQLLIAALYAAWLLILKPRSKRKDMVVQGEVAQFLSLTAIIGVSYMLDASIVVVICWLIGYFVARHVLYSYDEHDVTVLSMVWGLIVAEFAWLASQWTQAYPLASDLLAPQMAIIISLVGYVVMRAYDYHYHKSFSWKQLRAPILFAIAVITIMLLWELSVYFRQ